MDVSRVLASTGADIKGLTQLHCVPETSFPRPLWNQKWRKEPESAGCPQHGFLHKSSRAAQDAFYLAGRKTGSVAKSSELSAERRQCQATLDETAEQNRQKTVRTGLGPEQSRAPKHQRRSGCRPHKDRGGSLKHTFVYQQTPAFPASGTDAVDDSCSTHWAGGMVSGWFS